MRVDPEELVELKFHGSMKLRSASLEQCYCFQ